MDHKPTKQALLLLRDDLKFILGVDAEDEFFEVVSIEVYDLRCRIKQLEELLGQKDAI